MRNLALTFALLSAIVFVGCVSLEAIRETAERVHEKAQQGQKAAKAIGIIDPGVGTALSGLLSIISLVASYIAKRDTGIAHDRITRHKDKIENLLTES